jgi:hypothetical protein
MAVSLVFDEMKNKENGNEEKDLNTTKRGGRRRQ